MVVMLTLGDLSERFFQVLEQPDVLIHQITEVTPIKRDSVARFINGLTTFKNNLSLAKIRFNSAPKNVKPPANSISADDLAVAVSSDAPPTSNKPIPPDVTRAEDDLRMLVIPPSPKQM
jgi:hypothetical protein